MILVCLMNFESGRFLDMWHQCQAFPEESNIVEMWHMYHGYACIYLITSLADFNFTSKEILCKTQISFLMDCIRCVIPQSSTRSWGKLYINTKLQSTLNSLLRYLSRSFRLEPWQYDCETSLYVKMKNQGVTWIHLKMAGSAEFWHNWD